MESSQRALYVATLVLNNGSACEVEKLQQKCNLFPLSSPQIHELCVLPKSPLQVLADNKIGLTKEFLVELRSRLDTFEGACNATLRRNGATFLVPAVPSASLVTQPVKDGVVQFLDPKEVREQKPYIVARVHAFTTQLLMYFKIIALTIAWTENCGMLTWLRTEIDCTETSSRVPRLRCAGRGRFWYDSSLLHRCASVTQLCRTELSVHSVLTVVRYNLK